MNATNENLKKNIWSIYTRLFHIALVILVAIAYLSIEAENNIINHVLIGYIIAIIIFFRIFLGFLDIRCSQHSDLLKKIPGIRDYFRHLFSKDEEKQKGHNPASSLYILLIMVSLVLVTISGSLLYGVQETSGIFSSLNSNFSEYMLLIESAHKLSTTILLVLIVAHILGVVINFFMQGSDAILSMITGKKEGADFDVKLTLEQEIFGIIWITTSVFFMVDFYNHPENILTENKEAEINIREESYETRSSCGSCHLVYPAYLLPKQSWNKMMDNLENHFGKDASLPEEETKLVREYLMSHAAEHSTREAAVKVLAHLKTTAPQEITKTNYWVTTHQNITKEQFEADYGIKSDCRTCHKSIRNGMIQDEKIKFKF